MVIPSKVQGNRIPNRSNLCGLRTHKLYTGHQMLAITHLTNGTEALPMSEERLVIQLTTRKAQPPFGYHISAYIRIRLYENSLR